MIQKLLIIAFLCSTFISNSQNFSLSYPFSLVTTSSGLIDPTPTPTAVGVTSGSFTAVGTPSANPNAGSRFSFVGWPNGSTNGINTYSTMTGAINTSEYYEITITPQSGYTIALNTMSFTIQRSSTGIRSYAVRTNIDNYANNLPASIVTNTTNLSVVGTNQFFWNLDGTTSAQSGSTINFYGTTITSSFTLRFYGWNSEASGGTFSIDNVLINGDAYSSSVPCNPPFLWAINGNSPICTNQSLNLSSAILGSGPFAYDWSGSGSLSAVNLYSTSISSAISSDYTFSVSNACGTATSVVTATVNSLPTISVNSESICAGSSATLSATSTAASFVWNTGGTNAAVVVTPVTSPITYTVTGTDGNNCSASAIASVTLISLPTISVNSESICAGNSATLTVAGTASNYLWNTGDATPSIVVTPTTSIANYTVTGTDSNNCSATTIAAVTINALPIILVNSESICAGNSATLTVSGALTYTWSTSDNNSSIVVTPTTSVSQFMVMATDANNCENMAIASVTVNALPTISVNSESICAGTSATLTASGATTYTWSTSEINSSIVVTPTVSISQYMVMATDANNCENMAIANVTVNALPTISVNSESICAGTSATLTASGATTYTWSTSDNNSSIVVTPTVSISQYMIMATDANNCENMAMASVTVNALPTILVNSESICAGTSATLTASGGTTYTWSTSDNNSSIVVTPTGSVNQYTVIATDANNCENMSVASVTVNALPIVTLSTASVNLQCVTVNSVTLDGGTPLNGAYSGTGVVAGVFSPSAVGVGTYTITYAFTDGNNCSNSASDFITVDACTGIQNLKTESFTIYPNPVNDAVFINSLLFPANVNVFDVNGKLVISQNITALENEINLSNCVNGIYQLNITIGQKSFNYKIMINK